jgi:hypothetical protein
LAVTGSLALPAVARLRAQEPKPAPAKTAAKEPIERRPYRISVHLASDPRARIDDARRADLLREWQVLVRRFVGAPWVVSIADASSSLANRDLESIEPEAFASLTAFDKVWLIRIARPDARNALEYTGREYDTAARRLGPLERRAVHAGGDAPRELLQFARELFNPTAEIVGQEGGRAMLSVQGASLEPATPLGAVVIKGMVFQPLRLVSQKDGKVQILRIPFTYLQVESVERPVARCTITSALRDPFTKRMARPNSLAALGLKPGDSSLKLRFVNRSDQAPAAGYTLTARLVPDGQPRELGMTDREGRIVLKPGFASGLVILRLLAGNVEPIVELPMMPGESSVERLIPVDPKPLTVTLEAHIDSLRDEVVDLVAMRARLETRMKARYEGNDLAGLEDTLKEFSRLTPRDEFAKRLAKLKDDAANQQAELKTAVLTKTAQAQINDLQSMIDRYLDDETYKLYTDELERLRSEADVTAKTAAKKAAMAAKVAAAKDAQNNASAPSAADSKSARGQPRPKLPQPPSQSTVPF